MPSFARTYDVALLDLDGVVYIGADPVPHAPAALAACRAAGMRLAFVTNNAARPPETVARHLSSLNIPASAAEVVTSAQAAARILADQLGAGSPVLVVGGEGLVEALAEHDLKAVWSADEHPVAVVQGFHPDVGWRLLAEGAYALATGIPWVASNVDQTFPTPRGRAPGNGSLVHALRLATGREPVVAGKPEIPMHREAVLRTGARRPLVVGDRLDTDIDGANRSGADSLLVLTGVTDPAELVRAPAVMRPTYLAEDLRALVEDRADAVLTPGRTRYGAWAARVASGRLVLTRDSAAAPRRIDALRAACGAAWRSRQVPEGIADALVEAGW